MKKSYFPENAILLGLLSAQAIATFQVYLSNHALHDTLSLLRAQGYLLVPNLLIMEHLQEFTLALIGGLFFTCSIGAGISVLTLTSLGCWDRLFNRSAVFAIILVGIWGSALFAVNQKVFSPLVSLYFVAIPAVVAGLYLKQFKRSSARGPYPAVWIHIVPVLLMAMLWGYQTDTYTSRDTRNNSLFKDVRDNLLLSTKLGTALNDAYYRYSLYPAQVFKTMAQKQLKSCRIEGTGNVAARGIIEEILRGHDYLSATGNAPVDLQVSVEDESIVFSSSGKVLHRVSPRVFRATPSLVLKELSDLADPHGFFRLTTSYGLLLGFPLVLYILLHALLRHPLSLFVPAKIASVSATALCFAAGLSLLLFFSTGKSVAVETGDISEALASERWQDQVSALKIIGKSRLEMDPQVARSKLLHNSHIPVRYWLADALAVSRNPNTLTLVVDLLDDPHPNVASLALRALGKRRQASSKNIIIDRIEQSDHWHFQMYGYSALKALGWKQKTSEQRH